MNMDTARGIASRIWCDPEYEFVIVDTDLVELIAFLLMDLANEQEEKFNEQLS